MNPSAGMADLRGLEYDKDGIASGYAKLINGETERYNVFSARLLIRHASSGKKYLYDVLEIKKETSKSCQENPYPVETHFFTK